MGRRRAKQKKIATKKVVKLGIVFRCLQCNHEDAVDCKMDKAAKIGRLTCRVCGVTYQMKVNYLMEPIDVYCSWIDATKAMNEEDAAGGRRGGGGGGSASSSSRARQGGGYDDDDDSDVEEAVNPVEVAKRKQAEQESRDQQQDKDADDLFGSDSDSD